MWITNLKYEFQISEPKNCFVGFNSGCGWIVKNLSIFTFVLGLYLIINITSDCVETCNNKISYKTSFISKILGRKNWEISWKDIKLIKTLPTSQGSNVYYFNTNKDENILLPQRLENFDKFLLIISRETGIHTKKISYISPLWTYKVLTILSVFMIIGEIIAYKCQILSILNL